MSKCIRTITMSTAAAALAIAAVTGCGQARPQEQSESIILQTEAVPAVTEAPIVIQTEAPATELETQAPETPAAAPVSLSEEEELSQLYEFSDEEIGSKFANVDMNVRTSPTTDSEDNIVSSLDKGEEVTVIGETANWYEIYKAEDTVTGLTDLKGFVMKFYTSDTYDEAMAAQPSETAAPAEEAPAEAQPAEAAPAEAQPAEAAPAEAAPAEAQPAEAAPAEAQPAAPASGPQITVTSDANIRAEASDTGNVVGVVNAGSTVTQIGSADGWVQVDYNGVQGYIKSSMVSG